MSSNGDPHGAAGLLKEPLLQHLGQHERQGEGGCPHHQHPSSDEECQIEEVPPMLRHSGSSWAAVTTALLSLQLGWGLWLFPNDYARLGWCAHGILVLLAALTAYSGTLFTRLYEAVPGTVLFSDVGRRAAGELAARLVSLIVYSLDATRCVILHLAATQSLRHMFSPEDRPPLWQCGLVVFVGSSLLVQVRSMANMSWVFIAGTISQLVAVGIVVMELVTNPNPEADTAIVAVKDSSQYSIAAVAVMNMVFAFGGQFAFTEIICNMKQPRHFSFAVTLCTVIMSLLYGGLGTIGYWSQGSAIQGIVIFSLPDSARARFAAGCILLQATAQYLINVNVWTHNVLVIMARRAAVTTGSDHHEKLRCSTDHCRWRWLGVSTFVVGYSYLICISLPFFTTLVGLVTSVTYLACAYTLPAWFMLRLLGHKLWAPERLLLKLLIPASVLVSVIGLWGSVMALLNDLSSGEGWSSSHSSHGWAD